MRVTYINNDGGGFADEIDVADGAKIADFFAQKMGEEAEVGDYVIHVNRMAVSASHVLTHGDTVSITPRKFGGAVL